jgi:hypothetical protein
MKKGIYILFALLTVVPAVLLSQNILRSALNHPRTGDRLLKEQVHYQKPGDPGLNRTWDFSRIETGNDYPVEYFSRNDYSLISAESRGLVMYDLSGDSLWMRGYENPNNLVHYLQPALVLKYPVVYGVEFESVYRGRGKHDDRMESAVTGTVHTQANAVGKLILPGDTLENTIRIHIRRTETGYYKPLSPRFDIDRPVNETDLAEGLGWKDLITTDTYRWYEEGYRYPVFETVESFRTIDGKNYPLRTESYLYRPDEQSELRADNANQTVRAERQKAKKTGHESPVLSFDGYPNPVRNFLNVEISLAESCPVQLSLHDLSGKELYRLNTESTANYRGSIDMSAWTPGNYLLKISAGGETQTKKVVKY